MILESNAKRGGSVANILGIWVAQYDAALYEVTSQR